MHALLFQHIKYPLPIIYYPLSSICFPVSTFHHPWSSIHYICIVQFPFCTINDLNTIYCRYFLPSAAKIIALRLASQTLDLMGWSNWSSCNWGDASGHVWIHIRKRHENNCNTMTGDDYNWSRTEWKVRPDLQTSVESAQPAQHHDVASRRCTLWFLHAGLTSVHMWIKEAGGPQDESFHGRTMGE